MAIVQAVGHFKQTRNGAIVEMSLNIVISIGLVFSFGIVGVVAGTLVAMVFRTVQYAVYVSRNVIKRSIFIFIKRIVLSFACVAVIAALGYFFGLGFNVIPPDIKTWIVNAVITTLLALGVVLSVEMLFYKKDVLTLLELLKKGVRSKA